MIRLTKACLALFSKITPQIIPNLRLRLQQTKELSALGEYFNPHNTEHLFELVITSKLSHSETNRALDRLCQLCSTENDQQINILVNILKQKAINDARTGNIPGAISNFEQAISTILLLENPNQLILSQIYKFIGDLYIQMNELKKAQNALREAEHLLLDLERDGRQEERAISSGLACIYTQLCMIMYRDKRPMEALSELKKSLDYWSKVPEKLIQEYELTCRLKCMLHILFKENKEAVEASKEFLTMLKHSKEFQATSGQGLLLSRLYFMNIICSFDKSPEMEAEIKSLLEDFKGKRGEEKTAELMAMVGIRPDQYAS